MKAQWMAAGIMTLAGVAVLPTQLAADTRWGVAIVVGSDWGHHRGYRRGEAYHRGYDRGYRDGARHGQKDGRRCRDFDFWHAGDYRHGDHGYKGWMGPRAEYAAGYRRGYETGYRRAYASARPGYDWRATRRYDWDRNGERWDRDPYDEDGRVEDRPYRERRW